MLTCAFAFSPRPLAYSTLADLVHHVRQNLPLTDLSLAVQLFAKNIDDESLPSNIQTMSCKLLLNLVDCIRSKSEQENGNGRDILMRMLEVGSIEKIRHIRLLHNNDMSIQICPFL